MPSAPTVKRYRIRAESASWLIDQTELVGIARRGSARRIPWCYPAVAGVVDTEFGIFGLLTLAPHTITQTVPAAALCAVVQLSSGRVAVDIDQIEELPSGCADESTPRLADHLNTLTQSFGVSLADPVGIPATAMTGIGLREVFLHVRSGNAELAIPAKRIYRLDRHLGVRPIQPEAPVEWVVQLDNELLCATSLAAEGSGGLHATAETWCLCLDNPADARALLVAEVLGLIDVPEAQIKTLRHRSGHSRWIATPGREPLKVLGDSATGSEAGSSFQSTAEAVPGPQKENAPAAPERALSVFSGRYRIAFPDAMLGMVLGPLNPAALHHDRQYGDCPVIDLGKLLGDNTTSPGKFAVTLKLGHREVVILADHAEIATAEPGFSSVPSLPHSVSAYLRGIRLIGPDCELLANEQLTRQQKRALLEHLPRDAFLGWIAQPF